MAGPQCQEREQSCKVGKESKRAEHGKMWSLKELDLEIGNSPSSGGRRKPESFVHSVGLPVGFTFPDLRPQFLFETFMITVFQPNYPQGFSLLLPRSLRRILTVDISLIQSITCQHFGLISPVGKV